MESTGFQVTQLTLEGDRSLAVAQVLKNCYQLVVVDEVALSQSGFALLTNLRALVTAPIIVQGTEDEESIVQSLLQGADACLPRAASEESVMAHLRTLLRRNVTSAGVD
ncbi:MAG: hypothetical protein ACE5Q6_06660 [Dehalococcoidia bacterium]